MVDTILSDIKKLLGVDASYTAFDTDIKLHINSVFSLLHQVGAAPQDAVFEIETGQETWGQFISDKTQINLVKSYVYTRVRILFDPPQTSFGISALEKQASEFEWRLAQLEDLFIVSAI